MEPSTQLPLYLVLRQRSDSSLSLFDIESDPKSAGRTARAVTGGMVVRVQVDVVADHRR